MKKIIILIITPLILYSILKNYNIVNVNIIKACTLFLNNIFPSLFPMFIISSILINLNFAQYLNSLFKKITRYLFKINNNESYIIFVSIISGCPSNAKCAKEMYDNNLIDKISIQKILLFSHFSNPLFIISMIKQRTFLVLVAHYISNIIIGIITRNMYTSNNYSKKENKIIDKKISIILFESINNSLNTLLFILGTIVGLLYN